MHFRRKHATKCFHSNVIISQGDISKAGSSPRCLLNGPPFSLAIKATSGPRQGGDGRAKPARPFSIDSERNEQVEVIVWDSVWSQGDSTKATNKTCFFPQYNPSLSFHFSAVFLFCSHVLCSCFLLISFETIF